MTGDELLAFVERQLFPAVQQFRLKSVRPH